MTWISKHNLINKRYSGVTKRRLQALHSLFVTKPRPSIIDSASSKTLTSACGQAYYYTEISCVYLQNVLHI